MHIADSIEVECLRKLTKQDVISFYKVRKMGYGTYGFCVIVNICNENPVETGGGGEGIFSLATIVFPQQPWSFPSNQSFPSNNTSFSLFDEQLIPVLSCVVTTD